MNTVLSSPPVLENSRVIHDELSGRSAEADRLQGKNQALFQDGCSTTKQARERSEPAGLAAGIIHDFNNILHVIQAHTDLILSHTATAGEACEYATVIRDTVHEGMILVRQLSAESQVESRSEQKDINELIQRTLKSLVPVFPPNITVALDFDPRTPPVHFDAGLMYQCVLNLCMNARDAMPEGGNILVRTGTISGLKLRGRFPDASAEQYLTITVADSGPGMEAAVKERIFDAHFTTKKAGEGSGLGLSIVQAAIDHHEGFIDVTSDPGCGAAFRMYLPVPGKQPVTDGARPHQNERSSAQTDVTVLYAEDDVRLLGLMQRFLKREGVKVLTARDGIEALDVHRGHAQEIAAVIFDSHLTKLDGWEAFQRMRKINPKLKGILASGFVSAEAESRVAKGELSGMLQKPYFGAELLAMIKHVTKSAS